MNDKEFMEKARTLNFSSHGRSEGREQSPEAILKPSNGDDRFQVILPEGACECRSQYQELVAKAQESVDERSKTTERKTYQLENGGRNNLVGERVK